MTIGLSLRPATTLALFGFGAAAIVGTTSWFANPLIEIRRQEDLTERLRQVVPDPLYEGSLLGDSERLGEGSEATTVYRAHKGADTTAVAFSVTTEGYAGPIELLLAVDPQGTVLGVRVLAHTETPGLGDRIEVEKSDWILDFEGKSLTHPPREQWTVHKDGGVFDAFTGATITPRAVVEGVERGLLRFSRDRQAMLKTQDEERTDVACP